MESRNVIIKLTFTNNTTLTGKLKDYNNNTIELRDAYFLDDCSILFDIKIRDNDVMKIEEVEESIVVDSKLMGKRSGTKKLETYKLESQKSDSKGDGEYRQGSWNQFEANEKKFGIKAEFDESLYTMVLDKESEFYKNNVEKAKKIAYDILNNKSSDKHRMEERGNFVEGDEESKYSMVMGRKGNGRRKEFNKREAKKDARKEGEPKKAEVKKKVDLKKETERREIERKEAEKKEQEKRELERKEAERKEHERKEAEKKEIERKEQERKEAERKELEKKEAEKKELEKKASEKDLSKKFDQCNIIKNDHQNAKYSSISFKNITYGKPMSLAIKNVKEFIDGIILKFSNSFSVSRSWGCGEHYMTYKEPKADPQSHGAVSYKKK